jgi:iodotyrosine deiodinase
MNYPFIKYTRDSYESEEMLIRSIQFYSWMDKRRTVRDFSDKPIPKEVIDNILLTAGSAPSGAHKQPWTFCVVSNLEIKKQIRTAAEEEERE